MLKRGLFALFLIALDFTSVTLADPVNVGQRPFIEAAIPILKKALEDQLLDYSSAKFKDVRAGYDRSRIEQYGVVFCGEVNGKNSFGGYTGWTTFIAHYNARSFEIEMGGIAALLCSDQSINRDSIDYTKRVTP